MAILAVLAVVASTVSAAVIACWWLGPPSCRWAFQVEHRKDGAWYWLAFFEGRLIAQSPRGYASEAEARAAIKEIVLQ